MKIILTILIALLAANMIRVMLGHSWPLNMKTDDLRDMAAAALALSVACRIGIRDKR